jgi:hypothetical protein
MYVRSKNGGLQWPDAVYENYMYFFTLEDTCMLYEIKKCINLRVLFIGNTKF